MIKKKLLPIVLAGFYSLGLQAAPVGSNASSPASEKADQSTPDSVQHDAAAAEALASQLQKINTLSARFTQSAVDSKGQTKMEKGTMQLKKPDRFRWQVTEPFDQEIIAHGGKVWMLDPDFKQAVIKRQDDGSGPTPVQLLSGDARLFLKDYRVVRMNYGKEVVYTLRPAGTSELFESLDIHFASQQLSAISLKDSLGGKRRIDFSNVKINGRVKDALFVPDIQRLKKEGFDVIDESGA